MVSIDLWNLASASRAISDRAYEDSSQLKWADHGRERSKLQNSAVPIHSEWYIVVGKSRLKDKK